MSDKEVLRLADNNALSREKIVTHVVGKGASKSGKKWKSITAGGFIVVILGVVGIFMLGGNLVPAAISERIVAATSMYHADTVESQILVFQQALYNNDVPENTRKRLADNGVELVDGDDGLSLKYNGRTIKASDFVAAVNADAGLYAAFNDATYGMAAYWYDDAAVKALRALGTDRNNFTADDDFDEVMSALVGSGSNITINNVVLTEHETEDGETEWVYEEIGASTESGAGAAEYITKVAEKNYADSETTATLNAADILNKSDIMAKEQKSAIFFLAFMENISKMKAGDGNDSKINEAMNLLYTETENQVVDVKTGEVVTVKGSMVEAPSLYAVLADEKVNVAATENYASDRVLKTVENLGESQASSETLSGTVTSTTGSKLKGSIGRFVSGSEKASRDTLDAVTTTLNGSLINNSFDSLNGVVGGEMLVEGAMNVEKLLARASGGTAGDEMAAKTYAKYTAKVLALEAEADRIKRSPFDVSSPNTFLGALVRKVGAVFKNGFAVLGLTATADDAESGYLTTFGNCETLGNIGAVGSATCSTIMTFDESTLNDTFNDPEFIAFVEENTVLENGVRRVKPQSVLAKYIAYNSERKTLDGAMDGGILNAVTSGGSTSFVGDILAMIKKFLGASESEKRIASGAAFVYSASNPDWETYKYAQRYMSLARATDVLRQYDGDGTAYNNIYGFEGTESPVVAFKRECLARQQNLLH